MIRYTTNFEKYAVASQFTEHCSSDASSAMSVVSDGGKKCVTNTLGTAYGESLVWKSSRPGVFGPSDRHTLRFRFRTAMPYYDTAAEIYGATTEASHYWTVRLTANYSRWRLTIALQHGATAASYAIEPPEQIPIDTDWHDVTISVGHDKIYLKWDGLYCEHVPISPGAFWVGEDLYAVQFKLTSVEANACLFQWVDWTMTDIDPEDTSAGYVRVDGSGIPGMTLYWYLKDVGREDYTTVTGADGLIATSGVDPGTYQVCGIDAYGHAVCGDVTVEA